MTKNNLKEYSKVVGYFLFLIIFLFPQLSFAAVECSRDGYTIATINGINTSKTEASDNMVALATKLNFNWQGPEINYQYLYNPTHGQITDLVDSAEEKAYDGSLDDIQDSDFEQMLTDASTKITTQKVLLVGHSQGNFYANTFYDTLVNATGGIPIQSIGVYAVATPTNRIAGINNPTDSNYTTSETDNAIDSIPNILKPNVHINYQKTDDNDLGHSFSKIYMAYAYSKIVPDIEVELNNLKNNNVQNENAPCISPPKLTILQKMQGTLLAVTDPVSIPVQAIMVTTAVDSYKVASAVGNTIIGAAKSVTSGVSSLAQSIFGFGNNKNIALNTSADVVGAVDQGDAADSAAQAPPDPTPQTKTTMEATPPAPSITIQLPDVTQTKSTQAPPVVVADATLDTTDTTTPDKQTVLQNAPVSATPPPTLQELYPNLLPGGGGTAAPQGTALPPTPPPDTTAPIITVLGDSPTAVVKNTAYTDAGATATDDVDGSVSVITTGTVDTSTLGLYTLTYTATDAAGNIATATRDVRVSSLIYIPKFTFGNGNGDGNDWEVWFFNGSNVYDWTDTYVNHYLNEDFKVQRYGGGFDCSQCLQHGVFDRNPLLGFEASDIVGMYSDGGNTGVSAQGEVPGIYDVNIQWDTLGFTTVITNDLNVVVGTAHIDVANINTDTWTGWDSGFNFFTTFPSGIWMGVIPLFFDARQGGQGMMLQPYPVYVP